MPSESVSLSFSNQSLNPDQVSKILGMPPVNFEDLGAIVVSDRPFARWELLDEDNLALEEIVTRWVELLERVNPKLRLLIDGDLGAYLDVRVDDNVYLDEKLLSRLSAIGTCLSITTYPQVQAIWQQPEYTSTITISSPNFYSALDEQSFFCWLQKIEGVREVRGHLHELTIYLTVSTLSELALREVIGLLYRYDLPMSALRSQLTEKNEDWFKNPKMFWYQKVFEVN